MIESSNSLMPLQPIYVLAAETFTLLILLYKILSLLLAIVVTYKYFRKKRNSAGDSGKSKQHQTLPYT